MPDNSSASNPELWQKVVSGIGVFVGAIGGGWSLARVRAAKRKPNPAPVGWEEAISSLRSEMALEAATSRRIAVEAKEESRHLREHDVMLLTRRMERAETQAASDREETMSILDRISRDLQLLKRKLIPDLSRTPDRLPE